MQRRSPVLPGRASLLPELSLPQTVFPVDGEVSSTPPASTETKSPTVAASNAPLETEDAEQKLEESDAAWLPLKGLHERLEECRGTTFIAQYIGQVYHNARGGLSTNTTRFRGNFDLWTYIDTQKNGWWEDGTIGLYLQATHGRTLTRDDTGDYMFYSLLETLPRRNDVTQLGEFWYEHKFLDDKLSIRGGRLDGYLYLAYQEMTDGFLNTAFTLIPPTPLPSWPFQVFGGYAKYRYDSGVEWRFACYESKDAGPQYFLPSVGDRGVITFGEIIVPWAAVGDETAGSYRVGAFYDTQVFQAISTGPAQLVKGNYGVYAGAQRMLYVEKSCDTADKQESDKDKSDTTDSSQGSCSQQKQDSDDKPQQGLQAFVQVGWAPSDRNPLFQFFGFGLSYRGLLPCRDEDLVGLGYGNGMFGDESTAVNGATYEAVVETFYRWQTRYNLIVQPNLQFIANTGGNGRDSFPVGLQFIQKF